MLINKKTIIVPSASAVLVATALLSGCERQEFRMPPYVTKAGCEFTLVTSPNERETAAVPMGNTRLRETLSVGQYEITVTDCQIIDNPNGLPIYED